MATNLCETSTANTGKLACDVMMGAIKNIIYTKAWEPTADDLSSSAKLEAAIQAAALRSNDDPLKVFIFPVFHDGEDTTGEPAVETFPSGLQQRNVEPLPSYRLMSVSGIYQSQALANFNDYVGKAYVINQSNNFFYVSKSNGGGKGFTVGSSYNTAPRWRGFTGREQRDHYITFGNISEFKSGMRVVKADFDANGIVNLVDVVLIEAAAAAGDVFTIKGEMADGTPIYTSYKTPLNNADAWLIKRADTGAVVEVESVATDDVNGAWDITIADVITTGTKLVISFVSPADLAELTTPVEGIEARPLTVTKAA